MQTAGRAPVRSCVGCRVKRPQTQLVRCAIGADGRAVISRTAAGRGAWLCSDRTDCLQQAIKRRGFERAWKRSIGATELEQLTDTYESIALQR